MPFPTKSRPPPSVAGRVREPPIAISKSKIRMARSVLPASIVKSVVPSRAMSVIALPPSSSVWTRSPENRSTLTTLVLGAT